MHPALLFTTAHGDVTSLIQNEHVIAGIITAAVFIVMLLWVPVLTMIASLIRRETGWHGPLQEESRLRSILKMRLSAKSR